MRAQSSRGSFVTVSARAIGPIVPDKPERPSGDDGRSWRASCGEGCWTGAAYSEARPLSSDALARDVQRGEGGDAGEHDTEPILVFDVLTAVLHLDDGAEREHGSHRQLRGVDQRVHRSVTTVTVIAARSPSAH